MSVRASVQKNTEFYQMASCSVTFPVSEVKEVPTFVIDFVKITNFRPNRRQGTVLEALKNEHFLNTFLIKKSAFCLLRKL